MEFHHIAPQDGDMDGEAEENGDAPSTPDPPVWSEVFIIHLLSNSVHCDSKTATNCLPSFLIFSVNMLWQRIG